MQFVATYKNMESSEALTAYAREKLGETVKRFVTKPIEAHVTFMIEGLDQVVHIDVVAGDGYDLHLTERGETMYAAVDILADTLHRALKKHKERLKGHKGQEGLGAVSADILVTRPENAPLSEPAIDASEIIRENGGHAHA